jgi:hypothetical protein
VSVAFVVVDADAHESQKPGTDLPNGVLPDSNAGARDALNYRAH